eukprot:GFKZ01000367.1.p1 GENE.GFKZ01000367.1~~GFKZ01000367.1.p1  ORF type:complete len:126 (-),score=12.92 GFKZ01000367.1:746-1123(-)
MTSSGSQPNYDAIITNQQKRISELTAELAKYESKLDQLSRRAPQSYQAALAAAVPSAEARNPKNSGNVPAPPAYPPMYSQRVISPMGIAVIPQPATRNTLWSVDGSEGAQQFGLSTGIFKSQRRI